MGHFCPLMGIFAPKWAIEILYVLKILYISIMELKDRPKCGCGNTQNPEGYCDGSHNKI